MSRIVALAAFSICLLACGPKPRPIPDAGEEVDAGMEEVDAGRPRGDDPPNGWQVAVPLPMGAAASTRFVSVTSIADQYGQPMIAALYEDPNGDLNYDDNRVVFTRWNGVTRAFGELQTIEVVGGAKFEHPDRQISLSLDSSTGRIGIAYAKPQTDSIRLAVSDDEGTNFSLSTVSASGASLVSNPSLALFGGNTFLAWSEGSELQYRKRVGAGAFTSESAGSITLGSRTVSLAVDSAGNPGVAFFVSVGGTSADLAFWRPGSAPVPVASADMLDLTTPIESRPSATLTFVGTTPHLAFHLRKVAPLPAADDTTELWYAKATDSGATWSTPIAIPRNGSATVFHSTSWYQAIVIDASGRVNVAADFASKGAQTLCGGPKLARSTDGVSFMTCAPMSSPVQFAGDWISMWSHRAGKETIVFSYDSRTNASLKGGIVMWREL